MIASTQITNTEIFAFISVLLLKLLIRKVLLTNGKRQWKLLKSRLIFKKIADFTGQLLQNYKQMRNFQDTPFFMNNQNFKQLPRKSLIC